ncbi:MAG: hypothetical protein ONB48_07730 [candidate division KSB1 bacterium]|nr:hypothetical protein [candidate division KSB1 bacterium]MDZ7274712.1 hypothetical protein [candidate division KSB1 bacterium]MDZ7285537.1 hypothetical protein [candidate division KSB1 bacterium]MDZ7298569.1 hypothetical protein [candidate division KSB1 bacterium]MDZ7309233.1 hypothetical protein [candidate division KSB1 bacterium]
MRSCLVLLAWLSCLAGAGFAQQQEREWRDDFRNRDRIEATSNLVLRPTGISGADTGQVSLLTIDSTLSTGSDFRMFLRGIEAGYIGRKAVKTVVDIDVYPANPNFYLVTDAGTKSVFTYNSNESSPGAGDVGLQIDLTFTPADAHAFVEGGRSKVIVTGSDDADGAGHVVKYDLEGGPTLVWEYNATSQALKLLRPSDAVAVPGNLNQVIICDTGNDRLLAVDLTVPGDAGVTVLSGESFRTPVDIEVDRNDPSLYLVTDQGNHRVVLVRRTGSTLTRVFQFGTGSPVSSLAGLTRPNDADLLDNGNVLICDAGNDRLIEVTRTGGIAFRFESPLRSLTDADRIANNRTLAAYRSNGTDVVPRRLAYVTTDSVISQIFSFGRSVDFDSLFWEGEDLGTAGREGTRLRLKMRSSNSRSDLLTRPFFGPTSQTDYYDNRRSAINPIHEQNGDSLFQFLVRLETTSPLRTPLLTRIGATAHFIRYETPGVLLSKVIKDSADKVITDWRVLAFPHQGQGITVELINAQNNAVLASFTDAEEPIASLSARVPGLRGRQQLRLRATLRTSSPFVMANTPVLESWRLVYAVMARGPSITRFTDAKFAPVELYKFANAPSDSIFISVQDPTLAPASGARDTVAVQVFSTLSEDSARVVLRVNPRNFAEFRGGLPVAFNASRRNNDTLEVKDRDVLIVRYVDPDDNTDVSRDSARVIQRSFGQIRIENIDGARIDSIDVGGLFYLRVTGETDQNLSPTAIDSIQALVFVNKQNGEQELVLLFETAVDAGEFRTRQPLQVAGVPTGARDFRLRAAGGDDIIARYTDAVAGDVTADTIAVRSGTPPVDQLSEAFALDIAPNPFQAGRHSQLRLRARVRTGTLTIQRIEVYNLAGDLVAVIPGSQISLNGRNSITAADNAVIADGWWNRRTANGTLAASGTYFARVHVRLTQQPRGLEGGDVRLLKFVLIH